jgi:hypothetical protein
MLKVIILRSKVKTRRGMCLPPIVSDVTRKLTHLNLMFMDPCIVNIFQYISNKMQLCTVYLYLETALYVSGGTSTHHLEFIQLYLQHLLFVTPLLLSAAIAAGSIMGIVTNTRCCRNFYALLMRDGRTNRNM